jgi:hypothetical protein
MQTALRMVSRRLLLLLCVYNCDLLCPVNSNARTHRIEHTFAEQYPLNYCEVMMLATLSLDLCGLCEKYNR